MSPARPAPAASPGPRQVLLGYPYNVAIDMWSLGCVAAELFLGLPLFPGASEHDLLTRVVEMMGPPPDSLLAAAKHTKKFFHRLDVNEISPAGKASSRSASCSAGCCEECMVAGPASGVLQTLRSWADSKCWWRDPEWTWPRDLVWILLPQVIDCARRSSC